MKAIPKERKLAILEKTVQSDYGSIAQIARDEGLSPSTLYAWRREARAKGMIGSSKDDSPKGWNSSDKFNAVLACASLNEQQLAEYCRRNGLYPEQIKRWREVCEQANNFDPAQNRSLKAKQREDQKTIRKLEKDLTRKEKALAEAAALLVLAKKARAIWEDEDA